ncbi:hypothetical protein [Shinella sp. BYT-45]|uniref:hypothetical protein n=1 Tax=Shinella sp. BYT-45 TaxID=3377377 RepID=UPI00397E94CE
MTIWEKLLGMWTSYSQRQAERKALRLLVARKDRRLLRDAGLNLIEGSAPRCEPLPRRKERRWTAPLIRLPPPSFRLRGEGHGTPFSSDNAQGTEEKPAA